MADLAAHLVDEVLPKVAIRQWVCRTTGSGLQGLEELRARPGG